MTEPTDFLPKAVAGVVPSRGHGSAAFDPEMVREDFPPLSWELRPGIPLVYLDSAATSLKPWPVIRAIDEYLATYPANVHRGLHTMSERATEAFELARQKVAHFIGAADSSEVVFTHGTTESINLVAQAWGRTFLKEGDEIILSVLEHHSNIVPWQMLAQQVGAVLKFVDMTDDGRLDFDSYEEQLSDKVRLVAVTGMSNVLGSIPPVHEMVERAHRVGAVVVVDGAQSVPHLPIDVASLDADFLAFSAHKMCGPTGVGVLYGKREHLEAMPPLMGGGNMILRVDRSSSEWNDVPWKFEAGTPAIAEAIGLGAAVDYLEQFDRDALLAHERKLTWHAHRALENVSGVRVLGPAPWQKGGIVSFSVAGVHPHDLAQLLDREGVAIRAGHHCAMPLHEQMHLPASARVSFSLYNTVEEIDILVHAIEVAKRVFRRHQGQRNMTA